MDSLICSITQADGCTIGIADAERLAQDLLMRECQVYRSAGAPYGDTPTGFLRWLSSAERLTLSA
jgi:hypothetical protein